mmetsp:Transcript_43274/g.55591  ORF Transcript_43274/g.55591 Transcript_43274/m.55591 type:complete len:87 (-) Transcript_43274:101-361(-)
MFDDFEAEECYKVDQIVWNDTKNKRTKREFGWSASSIPCDVNGKVAEECYVNGVLKDIEYQQYTLTGNPTGFDMDDMIANYNDICK